jgi:CheY-like chemotaxis protein
MQKQLLLAEDNEDNMELMVFVVERGGLDVKLLMAENGQEAVDLAKENKPDLILMDMQMPVKDGFEATKELKADPSTQDIPIIAFTAQARAEDKEMTRSIGCVEHYTKPMDPEELIELIKRYLGE